MKKNRVVCSSAADLTLFGLPPRRPGRVRRAVRTGVLLAVIGLTRLAGHPRWRSAVVGAALTIPGLLLRDLPGNLILLPGLVILFLSPFQPGEPRENRARQARLRRELAVYSTPSDRRDLEAIFERYPDSDTGELRAILASQTPGPARPSIPGMNPS
jgi:hypothetical protein